MAEVPQQNKVVPDDEILKRIQFVEGGESDVVLEALYSSYGWIKILKIINNTNHSVHFENPYEGNSGDIDAGDSEEDKCKGWVPYYSNDKKYEISYYNENLEKRAKILIKDLGGDWLVSFYHQEGKAEDVRPINAAWDTCYAGMVLTINTDGYEIYEVYSKCKKGKELFGR